MNRPEQVDDSVAMSQYARFRERFMGRAIRTQRFRYVVWIESESGQVAQRELYDHATDPDELRNVAEVQRYQQDRQRLESRLRQCFSLAP